MNLDDTIEDDRSDNSYPNAGTGAPLLVKEAIKQYYTLPEKVRRDRPLLYWLLGSGTPPYKMSKRESDYRHLPVGAERCSNCKFAYERIVNGELICSQVRGKIKGHHWCRLWKP